MDPATFFMENDASRLAEYRHNYATKLKKLTDDKIKILLSVIRILDTNMLAFFSQALIDPALMPPALFLDSLLASDYYICLRACLLLFSVTRAKIVPRQYQLEATLETVHGQDSVVVAGTGQGKTMCTVLPLLLDPVGVSVSVSPLKRLQLMQVSRAISPWSNFC
jgi:ATP-dependent helicase YprA (DUF1998 family)